MAIFNPREAVQKLRDRGLEEPQADGIVEVVEEATTAATSDLVTKADLSALESRMEARFDLFEARMEARFAEAEARFAEAEARNERRTNRAIVTIATIVGIIAAIALAIAEFA